MELTSLDGLTVGGLLVNIASGGIIYLGARLASWLTKNRVVGKIAFNLANKFVPRTCVLFTVSLILGFISAKASVLFNGKSLDPLVVGPLTFSISMIYIQWRFARIGLHAAHLSVEQGTDYAAALSLCRDSFLFLGTGAYKLTSAQNFDETILRCNHGVTPVRFLLSTPDNRIIANAELQADVAPGSYGDNVRRSLRKLRSLRLERGARFEVRFYKAETLRDFQNFRMMFIDDETLLLSYNVYGRGDGRHLPQQVILKSSTSATDNFYFAYRGYFDRLWESSDPWDFSRYVEH
ncbi:hypothetical protein [Methylobacterium sp. R2-1]|uniref:hypothetical protein n=1 Tax=Methylobacterium sp. R2-1 TaxID=2587064 RepID=UPI00160DE401|nr:hypothetical protein [Methylobacterium sp. R2-1]MBB2964473.1 hypothetical protein [Methylobacterium sp. R2-1]